MVRSCVLINFSFIVVLIVNSGCGDCRRELHVRWDLSKSHRLTDVAFPEDLMNVPGALAVRDPVHHARLLFPDDRIFDEKVAIVLVKRTYETEDVFYIVADTELMDPDSAWTIVSRLCEEFEIDAARFEEWRISGHRDGVAGNASSRNNSTIPRYTVETVSDLRPTGQWRVRFRAIWPIDESISPESDDK